MKLPIFQIDAFTNKIFGGNPAAVCPLYEWLPTETMQKIAAENNLSETAFFTGGHDLTYELRWFTPTYEIDLCGHATLATAYLILEVLQTIGEVVKFQTKSGLLTVERRGDLFVLDFPSRPAEKCEPPEGLIDAIGKKPAEVLKARDYMLVYEGEREIREIKPNFNALAEIPTHAVIVTAKGETSDFVSRFFAPEVGVPEDPVTGSAHCTLIPYWAERLGKNDMFARQVSRRGGELRCVFDDDRVKIGGSAVLYMKGEIYV